LCRRALAVDEAEDVAAMEHTAAEGFALYQLPVGFRL
jgi:hypothetical protein